MENIQQKEKFLRQEYTLVLLQINHDAERRWGKMNVQQMIEHMSEYVRISSGKAPHEIVIPEEHLEGMRNFMKSEKPFKENTPNSLMPDVPNPIRHQIIHDAIKELKEELDYFFKTFNADPSLRTSHPFFGALDFDENVQLLHKHALHHLRQFGFELDL